MRILMVHGWAFGPWIWRPMNGRLRDLLTISELELSCVDLGFFGDTELEFGHFDLAIGHSLGLLWLLQSSRVSFDRLISINGFTRFSAAEDFQCGWPHRIIQRMRKRLAQDAESVSANFIEKSGATEWFNRDSISDTCDVERLDWGLEALINGDGREQWSKFHGPRRAIAATKDQIVSQEQTNQCFPDGDIQWLKSNCHCLPLKFPEICAALVRELIETS